jgi:hypothetical protein
VFFIISRDEEQHARRWLGHGLELPNYRRKAIQQSPDLAENLRALAKDGNAGA